MRHDKNTELGEQVRKKLYSLMVLFDELEAFGFTSEDFTCEDKVGLFQAVEELYMAWADDGERAQTKIDYPEA